MSRFIKKLHLRNLLSFDDCEVELQDLNVLIGPNGAGKSNLIESIGLLRSLVFDHPAYLRQGGGPAAWIWKGQIPANAGLTTTLEVADAGDFVHQFQLDSAGVIESESLHSAKNSEGFSSEVFSRSGNELWLNAVSSAFGSDRSVFHQHKSPADPGPTTRIGALLASIRIYREFRTGKRDPIRIGASSAYEVGLLEESGQNLAAVLHELDALDLLDGVRDSLRELNPDYDKVRPRLVDGLWLIQLSEDGLLDPILSPRISDGTLKLLCLAALLLHPMPPPLICLEEPEVGLHPEALRIVANLLKQASERTQLVVTTHSVDLVDEFTATPEVVLVTQKNERHATGLQRLDRERLDPWLKRYQLGELWQKGEIGGNRW